MHIKLFGAVSRAHSGLFVLNFSAQTCQSIESFSFVGIIADISMKIKKALPCLHNLKPSV